MPARVTVFLDYQNVYRRARDAFCLPLDPATCGQVSPIALARLITSRGKGIDVALAIDLVVMAITGEFDIGVLMSTDTDLKPALEAIPSLARGKQYPRCEVAAWSVPGGHSRRLSVPGEQIWCHWLDGEDFLAVADSRDYNVAP